MNISIASKIMFITFPVAPLNHGPRKECVALLAEDKVGERPVELHRHNVGVEHVHRLPVQHRDPRPLVLVDLGQVGVGLVALVLACAGLLDDAHAHAAAEEGHERLVVEDRADREQAM